MKNRDKVIECLRTTPIVQIACQKSGISRATYYRWRKEDKKFRNTTDTAVRAGVGLINDLAESQLISLIKDKHPTAIFYWLNHRHPEFSDRRLILPITDQSKLIKSVTSFRKYEASKFIITKMIQGVIPGSIGRVLLPIIGKFSKQSEVKKNDDKVANLGKLIDLCSPPHVRKKRG